MIKKSWFKKSFLVAVSIAALGIGIYYVHTPRGPIYEYDEARDTQDILNLFRKNWYWLTASDDYSPEFMLKHRAPNKSQMYLGQLRIKVLREKDTFVGFSAYYMKAKDLGFILFVAVEESMRGKRYGEQLMRQAIDELGKMGAKRIDLVTRTNNYSGQKLYTRLGFQETLRDSEGFVYYTYYVK